MAKPSRYHTGGRYMTTISFDLPGPKPTVMAVKAFIKDALESSGGCRHPEDELFHSLGQVTIGRVRKKDEKRKGDQ